MAWKVMTSGYVAILGYCVKGSQSPVTFSFSNIILPSISLC